MHPQPWYPDEKAYAGPEHFDPAHVAGYDVKSGVDPTEDVSLLGLGPGDAVVDLGCGTGRFALEAGRRCGRVVAVDVSAVMLDRLRALGAPPNVEIVHAGLLSYVHAGERADAVYCRNVLHHLPDAWKAIALSRIRSVLKPGGTLLLRDIVYSFDVAEFDHRIDAWLAAAPSDAALGWTRDELGTHVATEHSTFSWLLEPMLEHAGFEIVRTEHRENRVFSMYLCRAR